MTDTVLMHCSLSVRGALSTMKKRDLARLFRHESGRRMTADEAKETLMQCLADGKEALPFGPACEGFDYAGGGCPGHPPA